jgi:phytoene desaturase
MLVVDEGLCVGCGLCLTVCPREALNAWGCLQIDQDKCAECLDCIEICPVDALRIERRTTGGRRMDGYGMEENSYDVVVIGSGVGGICSAALLSRAGYRTLVVEKLPFLGGRFSTIEYKGFKCTTGALVIKVGGLIEQICEEVGAKIDVRPARKTACWMAGRFHELPEKGALRTLISAVAKDNAETETVMSALRRGLTWMEPTDAISFRDWLLQYTNNEKILQLFKGTITSVHTVNDDELPAGEYFRFIKRLFPLRFGYASGGNITIVQALAKVVQDRGGDVWTRCTAKRVLLEAGMVKGVVLENPEGEATVQTNVVISNTGPVKTVEMAGREYFDKGYIRQLRETIMPTPIIWIHFTSERPLTEYSAIGVCGARRVNLLDTPTLECPELAPPGKHLSVSGSAPLSSSQPVDFKREVELSIQDLREILPGFDRHAQVLWVSCFRNGWPAQRVWCGHPMPHKTPLENLYNVGDAMMPRGTIGTIGAAESARIVSEEVKSRGNIGRSRDGS